MGDGKEDAGTRDAREEFDRELKKLEDQKKD